MAKADRHRRVQDYSGRRPLSSVAAAPIGVFDSGVGGLSVLRALVAELPGERFVYLADSAHAPYGERDGLYVIERSRIAVARLRHEHAIKALVVACNTATAAAIHLLRAENPGLPIVGVEPALKPALAQSHTRRIGVLATRATLASAKYAALQATLAPQAEFVAQPCDGLASAIERFNTTDIIALCNQYTRALGTFGTENGQIDTLVLGCTHYPFAEPQLRACVGRNVALVETGLPVARQTRRLLEAGGMLAAANANNGGMELLSTGDAGLLREAAARWLKPAHPSPAPAGVQRRHSEPKDRAW